MMSVTCPGPGGAAGGTSVKSPTRTRLRLRKGAKILPKTEICAYMYTINLHVSRLVYKTMTCLQNEVPVVGDTAGILGSPRPAAVAR